MDHLTHNLIPEPSKGSHSESQNSYFTSPETSNGSLYEAAEEEDETLKPPPVTKKIQKIPFKKKKKYRTISDSLREKLIEAVEKGEKIKHAAKKFNINYSSAKSICQVFKKEGRSSKKTFKVRGGHNKHLQTTTQIQKKESFDSSLLKSESDVTPDNTKLEPGVRTRGSLKIEANAETTPAQNSSPGDGWALKQKITEEKPVQYSNLLQQNAEENEKINNILAQNSVLMNKSLCHQPTAVMNPQSLVIHTPQVFMQNNFNNLHPSALLNNLQYQRINNSQINYQKHANISPQNFPLLNSLFSSGFENNTMNNHGSLSLLSQNYQQQQQQIIQFNPAPNNLNLLNNHPVQMNNDIQSLLLNQINQQRSMNTNPFQNNLNFY